MKQVICISGKRGAGKSTLGRCLEKYGYKRLSLAGELKEKCKKEFNLTEEQVNGSFKESPTQYKNKDGVYLSPREIMIQMGQFYRSIDGMFWLKQLDKVINEEDNVVIDDVRFLNEIKYFKDKYGALLIRLERDVKLNLFKFELNDISETELDEYKEWHYKLSQEQNRDLEDLQDFARHISSTVQYHK